MSNTKIPFTLKLLTLILSSATVFAFIACGSRACNGTPLPNIADMGTATPSNPPPSECIPCKTDGQKKGGRYLNDCLPTLCVSTPNGPCCAVVPQTWGRDGDDGYRYVNSDGGWSTID